MLQRTPCWSIVENSVAFQVSAAYIWPNIQFLTVRLNLHSECCSVSNRPIVRVVRSFLKRARVYRIRRSFVRGIMHSRWMGVCRESNERYLLRSNGDLVWVGRCLLPACSCAVWIYGDVWPESPTFITAHVDVQRRIPIFVTLDEDLYVITGS